MVSVIDCSCSFVSRLDIGLADGDGDREGVVSGVAEADVDRPTPASSARVAASPDRRTTGRPPSVAISTWRGSTPSAVPISFSTASWPEAGGERGGAARRPSSCSAGV